MKFLLMKGTIDLRKKNNSFDRLQNEIVKIEIQIDYGGVNQNTVELSKLITLKSVNALTYLLDHNPKHFNLILNFFRNDLEGRRHDQHLYSFLTSWEPLSLNSTTHWNMTLGNLI